MFDWKTIARFWSKVSMGRGDDSVCWEWRGSANKLGYGTFYFASDRMPKSIGSHRFAWIVANGDFPSQLFVCHRCDNPRCVNPSHLFLGTQKDNMRDCSAKGRARNKPFATGENHIYRKNPDLVQRGQKNPNALLSDEQVLSILKRKAAGERAADLAKEFDLGKSTIEFMLSGRSWKHIRKMPGCPSQEQINAARNSKPTAKLSQNDVDQIRIALRGGVKGCVLAKIYGVCPATISHIRNATAWS